MTNEDEFKRFINKNQWIIRDYSLQETRDNFLNLYMEDFIEILFNLFISALKYPNSFDELEALADDENKGMVNMARKAFEDNFVEVLCSIKSEIPDDLIDDFEAELNKFKKSIYFNDAKQDWYKIKDAKLPKKFDVTKREYYDNPLILEEYKSGKTLMAKYKSWKYENEID